MDTIVTGDVEHPKPFEIRCLNHELKFSNERFRPYLPFFYIDVMRCEDFYDIEEIWQQPDLLDFGDFEKEGTKPEVEIYYPYHDPVFVRLHWWNDTYSGIVAIRAVEQPGWVKLPVSYEDVKFETYKGLEEEFKRHAKRHIYIQMNDAEDQALQALDQLLKDNPSMLDEENRKTLRRIAMKARLQRSW